MVAVARGDPFDAEAVTPFLRSLVAGKRRLFHHFADLDEEDLLQVALLSAREAHLSYDAALGSKQPSKRYHHVLRQDGLDRRYVSWLGKTVTCDLIDLYRKRVRQANREARAAVSRDAAARVIEWHDAGEEAGLPGGLGDGGDELLHEWLGKLYRYAVRAFATPENLPRRSQGRRRSGGGIKGPKIFSRAQCVCATLLMRREHLSSRAAAALFAGDADLMTALQLKRVPSYHWFVRARRVAAHLGIPDEPAGDASED